jgi:hypothetical protein
MIRHTSFISGTIAGYKHNTLENSETELSFSSKPLREIDRLWARDLLTSFSELKAEKHASLKTLALEADTTLEKIASFGPENDISQKKLTDAETQHAHEALVEEVSQKACSDEIAMDRLKSLKYSCSTHASTFLKTIPYDWIGNFENATFKTSMEMYLGLPISAARNLRHCKFCKQDIDRGYHPLVCKKAKSKIYYPTHSALQRDLCEGLAQGSDTRITREPHVGLTDDKRCDILVEPLGPKIPRAFVDVTSKNPFSVPSTNWCTVNTGFAAELAVKLKHKKYDEVIKCQPGPTKPSFFAFAIETTGAWAKENSIFLEHLNAAALLKLPDSFANTFLPSLKRKISLNHRKHIVQGLLDVLGCYMNPFQPDQHMPECDLERELMAMEFEQEPVVNQVLSSALPSGSAREAPLGLPVEDPISPGEVSEVYDVYDIIGGRPPRR